jgi:hypothetical protein
MGFSPGTETQGPLLGNVLTTTVTLTSGTQYYFEVTAYNGSLSQSAPSNEVSFLAP